MTEKLRLDDTLNRKLGQPQQVNLRNALLADVVGPNFE